MGLFLLAGSEGWGGFYFFFGFYEVVICMVDFIDLFFRISFPKQKETLAKKVLGSSK